MRRHRPPTLVSMWMLDVFCCALGCVTLLWLLKTRDAGISSDEATSANSSLIQTQDELDKSKTESALRLANAEKLATDLEAIKKLLALARDERDENAKNLALVKEERDKTATNLALVKEESEKTAKNLALTTTERDANAKTLALIQAELAVTKKNLTLALATADELDKTLKGLNSKMTATDAELAKKRGEMEAITKKLDAAKKQADELETLVRDKDKMRTDAEAKLKASDAKLDSMTKTASDAAKAQARLDAIELAMKAQKTQLDQANITIVDLQGTKAKLADKINQLQVETDNKFAGIALTGKNVVFLVDMSGSMDRTDENTVEPTKWPAVRDTVCKLMTSLPALENFQVILFSTNPGRLLPETGWIKYEKGKSIERVKTAMTAVKPTGDTNMYLGLEEAFKFRAKGMDTVYLISDGLPTSGPGLTAVQERQPITDSDRTNLLSRHVRRTLQAEWNKPDAQKQRVRINSVGFFYESPDVGAFLWALSRENDGSFVGMSRP